MTGGIEAAGDAMTGAVIARAIEPAHGEGDAGHGGACLNCGTALIGPHCHSCGQAAHVHRSLSSLGHDLLHGVFHFEGKVWRTLPMLLFKPGDLTRRYIHGERAKFVSPLAMFLFAVFLMFAIVTSIAGELHMPEISPENRAKSLKQIETELIQNNAKKAALTRQMKAVRARGGDADPIDAERDAVEQNIDGLELARDFMTGNGSAIATNRTKEGLNFTVTGWPRLDAAIKKANENPNLLIYKLQSSAYKYAWALIPLSTPFVWLMFFWKRQYKLYDHAIFVTISLTFMMFLVIVLTIAGAIGMPTAVVASAGTFIPPLHLYRQLRGAYRVSRIGALLRTFILAVVGGVVLTMFLLLLLALGVMG